MVWRVKKKERKEKKNKEGNLYTSETCAIIIDIERLRENVLSRPARVPLDLIRGRRRSEERVLEVSLSAKDVLERVGEPRASVEVTFLGTKSSFNLSFPSEQTTTIKRTSFFFTTNYFWNTNYFINVIKWWKYIYGFFLIIHRTGYREISNFRR